MKLHYKNNKWNDIRQRSRGYAALAMVALLGITALLGLVAVFRQGMRSHESQIRNQIKVDYKQKEDALLRALVAVAPNMAIGAMQAGSSTAPDDFSWDAIFTAAINAAKAETALSANVISDLEASYPNIISANTGDVSLSPNDIVGIIAGTSTGLVGEGITANGGLTAYSNKLPPALVYPGENTISARGPIITTEKRYAVPDVALFPAYNSIPYPDIRFGYSSQSGNFIAKRNWWAFSLTFGGGVTLTNNDGTAASQIATVTKNYVLSIYEVPSQLAVSAGAALSLESAAWAAANIEGGIFGTSVQADGLTVGGNAANISARKEVNLGGGASVGGAAINNGFDAVGTREQRLAGTTGTGTDFGSDGYRVSHAGSSGRVAILPISQGNQFVRRALNPITDSLSPTGWDAYGQGSRQCSMGIEILATEPLGVDNANKPVSVRFHYIATTGLPVSVDFAPFDTDGNAAQDETKSWSAYSPGPGIECWENFNRDRFLWDHDGDDPDKDGKTAGGADATPRVSSVIPFYWENLKQDAVPTLTIKLDRFPDFLAHLGMRGNPPAFGVDIHRSLAVWTNNGVTQPSIPAVAADMGVVIRAAENLANVALEGYAAQPGYTRGFSLVTDHRVYLVGEINQTPTAAPPGAVLPAGVVYFPPMSIFAAEKRFGTADTAIGNVTLDGQLTSLQEDNGDVVDPLALTQGTADAGTAAVSSGAITANLSQITSPAQLAPVNKMSWLVIIEELNDGFSN